MPTYDYRCGACGHQFETVHNMGAPGPQECPSCHAQGKLERLISSSGGFQLRGSGWYATDYKAPGGGKAGDGAPSTSGSSGD
jgi:putative FmdB family regulatory protein